MRIKIFMGIFCAVIALFGFQATAESGEIEIPDSLEVTAKSGVATIIYGQRERRCGDAPSFEWTMERAVTRRPTDGTLLDAGVGKRFSGSCDMKVPVRAISYTSKEGFVGTDAVVFWGRNGDRVIITVVP